MEESNPVIAPVKIPHVLQVSNELIKKLRIFTFLLNKRVPKHECLGTLFYFYARASATAGARPGEQEAAVRGIRTGNHPCSFESKSL